MRASGSYSPRMKAAVTGHTGGLGKAIAERLARDGHEIRGFSLEDGYDIRTLQALLGHRDVSTTMIYTHVLDRGPGGVRSPADSLADARRAADQPAPPLQRLPTYRDRR